LTAIFPTQEFGVQAGSSAVPLARVLLTIPLADAGLMALAATALLPRYQHKTQGADRKIADRLEALIQSHRDTAGDGCRV
jgi:hypothetical protein